MKVQIHGYTVEIKAKEAEFSSKYNEHDTCALLNYLVMAFSDAENMMDELISSGNEAHSTHWFKTRCREDYKSDSKSLYNFLNEQKNYYGKY